jgi:ComF family protein
MVFLRSLRHEMTGLIQLFLPPSCPLCARELAGLGDARLCGDCREQIPPLPPSRCPLCALPFVCEDGSSHLCEPCIRNTPPFTAVAALGAYEGTLRHAVHRFKYQGQLNLDRPLGEMLAEAVRQLCEEVRPDLLVPVPLHPSRLRHRSYNQALLLARELGRKLTLPVASRLLQRCHPTPPQQGLSAKVRCHNLKGAFVLARPLAGERILLVDDVMTTGATATECTRTLLEGGGGDVAVAVLGRARRRH